MNKIKYYLDKYKLFILIILILVILLFVVIDVQGKVEDTKELDNTNIENITSVENNEPELLKVDIKGFVKKPGVYELAKDSRIIDVIKLSGGLIDGANTEYINLSKKITDEMIIIIYSNNEVEKYKKQDKEIIYIEYECVCPDNINDACINKDDTVNTNGTSDNLDNDVKRALVSINTCTVEDLINIPYLGETKAKAIIEYREKNGEFKNIEDIKNVSGIGDKLYSKIKDYIKL